MTPPTNIGRVAFFLPSLRGGGAERSAVNLAAGFAARGVVVDMVLARAAGPYLQNLHPDVRVVDLGAPRVLYSLPRLSRYLRSQRPDAMVCFMDHANLVALAARWLSGAPTRVIGTVHHNKTVQREQFRGVKVRAVTRMAWRAYPRLDAVVAVSHGVAESLARESGMPLEDIHTIYNPIVTPGLEARLRAAAPGARGGGLVVGMGRLDAPKDFETLIRAFVAVRARRPARLLILGDGPGRPQLQALANQTGVADDVTFAGFVDDPYTTLLGADVFVLSSRSEGLPTALIEAMACGCPVVSTNCPSGPEEILEGGRHGRLVPVGDAAALADAIVETMESPPDRDMLRRRAGDFSLEKSVDAYLALCASPGKG